MARKDRTAYVTAAKTKGAPVKRGLSLVLSSCAGVDEASRMKANASGYRVPLRYGVPKE
jgi:hypothetical protein